MTPIPVTPLENQIARTIGLKPGQPLQPAALQAWQLDRINHTIAWARSRSPFYRQQLAGVAPGPLPNLEALPELPLTTAQDLSNDPGQFLCVSRNHIARVVTLQTSGTTQAPKRIFFTDDELERTIDFFHHGMSTLVQAGQKVLILLPGSLPDSVGDLLVRGLARMNVTGLVHGPVTQPRATLEQIQQQQIDCLVGIPVQVLALARHVDGPAVGRGRIASVLLSTDYVPQAIVNELRRVWGCEVFQHYGMTEMGLGGGVACRAFAGYHLREADLYVEIIDSPTGAPLATGQPGEVVFTTLNRQGMPLIRYRTGDRARLLTAPCPCRSRLRRLETVSGRIGQTVTLKNGAELSLPLLDETLFVQSDLLDYRATLTRTAGADILDITIHTRGRPVSDPEPVRRAIMQIPQLAAALRQGLLVVGTITSQPQGGFSTGVAKRRLMVQKG